MSYTALYTLVLRARNITCKLAKMFVWVFGLLAAMAYVADAPLTILIGLSLRVVLGVVTMVLAPRLFDAALRRIVHASHRAG